MADIRTLNFLGYAYGDEPVIINAHVNGKLLFQGEVPTLNEPLPHVPYGEGLGGDQVLFSMTDPMFTTDFAGSYPMTITVANGYGVKVGNVLANFMPFKPSGFVHVAFATLENSSINGTTLTVGNVSSGEIIIGMIVTGEGILPGTEILSGSGSTYTVSKSQNVGSMTIQGTLWEPAHGNATTFSKVFTGTPTNSEGTLDPRSSVKLDDVQQVPPLPVSTGVWTWLIPTGSTLSYNLNISYGNQDIPPPQSPAP